MKLHIVDSRFESSGVGALDNPAKSTSPVLLSDNYNVFPSSARHYVGVGTVSAADSAAPIGPSPSPLGSSGADQLRVPGLGPLTTSPSFPPSSSSSSSTLPPPPTPGFSVSSVSFAPSLPSSSSASSSFSSSPYFSSSAPLPPAPSSTPSSLSSASFLSSSFVTPSLPPSISSLFPPASSSQFLPTSSSASSSSPHSPFYPPSSSSASLASIPSPPGFPPSSSSFPSSSLSSALPVPPFSDFSTSSFLPPSVPPPPLQPSSSSVAPPFPPVPSALADHQARLLGLSSEYQSLARWFLTSGGTDFAGLVRSSFPHLLPDLACNFTSGSSLLLTTLCSVAPPPLPPASYSTFSSASHPPLAAHLSSPSCSRFLAVSRLSTSSSFFLASASWFSLPFLLYFFCLGFFLGTRVGCGCPSFFGGSPSPSWFIGCYCVCTSRSRLHLASRLPA